MAVVSTAVRNTFSPLGSSTVTPPVPVATPSNTQTSRTSLQGFSTSNPPFAGVTGQSIAPVAVQSHTGGDPRIVRGYIRRENDGDATDPTARYRLNFMYNPETVQRQFIAYLDQNALDPFNTVHGSGNITAPPGILDFSFELLFDRQVEVMKDPNHPGVKVDYDYFDMVVRGVVPHAPGAGANAVPDNGVMMVNPRNITIVFGPELTVTGRPYNASISYDKFSHKMTATRVRIQLQMKVLHIGPRPLAYTYQTSQQQAVVAATVPYDNQVTVTETNKSKGAGELVYASAGQDAATLFADLGLGELGGYSFDQGGGGSGSTAPPVGSGGGNVPAPILAGYKGGPPQTDPKHLNLTQWAHDLLKTIGVSDTGENLVTMVTWAHAEGGSILNKSLFNPLNSGMKLPGENAAFWGSQGGQLAHENYVNGVIAAAKNILLPGHGYPAIVACLQRNAPAAETCHAIQVSDWAASHYADQGGLRPQPGLVGRI